MGLLDRIFGTDTRKAGAPRPPPPGSDVYALERYRYMLQTAPPETIEQAHAEAFEQLSPEQRRQVLAEIARSAPNHERTSIERTPTDDPRALARVATRAEFRQPGVMERTLGASPGAGFGAGLLGSFAAAFAGSMVANSFFSALGGFDGFGEDVAGDGADNAGHADATSGADDDGGSLAGVGDLDGDPDGAGGFDDGDFGGFDV
ncbi:MAG TPA: hypothetical protein VMG12_08350 [Polyangiaceae bacterium]|nr:hypothetical protein [Polyangiaceae bacterium]